MTQLALHVYHLDDDSFADHVVHCLKEAGVARDWKIERPTDATNAILLPVDPDEDDSDSWEDRNRKIEIAVDYLRRMRPEPLDVIRESGLRIAMRVHTREAYLPLPVEFVRECGRLGLQICILNERLFYGEAP